MRPTTKHLPISPNWLRSQKTPRIPATATAHPEIGFVSKKLSAATTALIGFVPQKQITRTCAPNWLRFVKHPDTARQPQIGFVPQNLTLPEFQIITSEYPTRAAPKTPLSPFISAWPPACKTTTERSCIQK